MCLKIEEDKIEFIFLTWRYELRFCIYLRNNIYLFFLSPLSCNLSRQIKKKLVQIQEVTCDFVYSIFLNSHTQTKIIFSNNNRWFAYLKIWLIPSCFSQNRRISRSRSLPLCRAKNKIKGRRRKGRRGWMRYYGANWKHVR